MAEGRGRTGLIVLGMHRSGTSLTAQLLGELGWSFGGEVLPSRGDNPSGYFEHAGVVAIHNEFLEARGRTWDDPRPLGAEDFASPAADEARRRLAEVFARDFAPARRWVLKDPRMCRLLPLWDGLLGPEVRFLHVDRHPQAVAASLAKRDGMSPAWADLLWLRHVLESERSTRGSGRAWMGFEELVADPRAVLGRVAEHLGFAGELEAVPEELCRRIVRPDAVHHEGRTSAPHPWVSRVLAATAELRGGESPRALSELDAVAAEMDEAEGVLAGERDAAAARYLELTADRDNLAEHLAVSKRYVRALEEELAPVHLPSEPPKRKPEKELPVEGLTISIIVNTCDRCPELQTLLHALKHQTYRDFEVVVVLGPTRDRSLEMIREELGERVVVVPCPERNLCVSRNLGLRNAAGDVVAFVDDDAVPAPTWLAQLAAAYLGDPAIAGVGGRTYQVHPDLGDVQFLNGWISVLGEQDDVRWTDEPPFLPSGQRRAWFPRFHGTNMSYRRAALVAVGGFDERYEYLFDDADLAVRLGTAGFRLEHTSEGVVYHAAAKRRDQDEFIRNLNWYSWLRATLYFTLKNGPPAVGWYRTLTQVSKHLSYFYWNVKDLRAQGIMPPEIEGEVRAMLRRGWFEGIVHGLLGRRRLPAGLTTTERPFQRFKKDDDPFFPAVPLTGLEGVESMKPQSSKPLRICLLSAGYPPRSTEGVARSTHVLARGLAELGHEVHVVTAGERRRVVFYDGAYVHEVKPVPNPRYAPLAARYPNLRAWLEYGQAVHEEVESIRVNHDVQLVDSALWNLDGLVTAVSGVVPVAVRVVTAMKQIAGYSHTPETDEERLIGDLEKELLARADLIVLNSKVGAETLEEVYGFDLGAARHEVVHYGIVPTPEDEIPPPEPRDASEVTVLYVGRLESRKGTMELFEAIPEVLAEHPRTRFLIAGGDNSLNDGFQEKHGMDYPAYFAKHFKRCAKQVDFLGFVSEEELHRLYRNCDVFVAPSRYESFGLIYLEAMDYSRPTIGCRAGGPREVIADGETGLLVPPADSAALAEAISKLVADPELREEMGRAGRRRLLEKFTHTKMAAGFADAYRRTLGMT